MACSSSGFGSSDFDDLPFSPDEETFLPGDEDEEKKKRLFPFSFGQQTFGPFFFQTKSEFPLPNTVDQTQTHYYVAPVQPIQPVQPSTRRLLPMDSARVYLDPQYQHILITMDKDDQSNQDVPVIQLDINQAIRFMQMLRHKIHEIELLPPLHDFHEEDHFV